MGEPHYRPREDRELLDELLRDTPDTTGTFPARRASRTRRLLGRLFLGIGAATVVFVVLYAADLLASIGDVPRGVTVAGVEVGGLDRAEAESVLRRELATRLLDPIPVRAGDVDTTLDPVFAGLGVDWSATVAGAGAQPLNPVTRVLSFFTEREVGVSPTVDIESLRTALRELAQQRVDRTVREGGIAFGKPGDGSVRPFVIEPRAGQRLTDVHVAASVVLRDWLDADRLDLPVRVLEPKVASRSLHATLDETVAPAVSGPMRVVGDGASAILRPEEISDALEFSPTDGGELRVTPRDSVLRAALRPDLRDTEREPKSARIVFRGGSPEVDPSRTGRTIDWNRTLDPFLEVAKREGEQRLLAVAYRTSQPETTTEEAAALGITEVVGEFTTGGFAATAERNLGTIAEAVNGTLVPPGRTYSLDGHTGARTASQGYVVAPVHEDGSGPEVIGGGVSQFTSTLYNAAYLAGMTDAGHTPHRHYSDSYPPARDAVSLREDGSRVDLAFINDTATGVAIQAWVREGEVTVRLWGTRRYRVESTTGRRTEFRPPPVVRGEGPDCTPARGRAGFTVADTRTVYDYATGARLSERTTRVRYEPVPTVVC